MIYVVWCCLLFFFVKQKTAYEMRISDWSSDVCSSDLEGEPGTESERGLQRHAVEHYMQVAARQADAIDPARHFRARLADRRSNRLLPGLRRLDRTSVV